MQFSRYITYSKNRTALSAWQGLIKISLVVASFYFIGYKIWHEKAYLKDIFSLFTGFEWFAMLLFLLVLMTINWSIEAKKWQIIANSQSKINFISAFKSVVSGIALDALVPFGIGAVGAKIFSINTSQRRQLAPPLFIAQGMQTVFTVVFGFLGVNQLAEYTSISSIFDKEILLIEMFLLGGGILILFFLVPKSYYFIRQGIRSINFSQWVVIFFLSFVRYVVFFIQMFVLSTYLAPQIPTHIVIGCITFMFFTKTILPKPGHLGALGIRGTSVIFFLNAVGYSSVGVVLASIVIWFINLALPSIIGLFYIKNLKFKLDN